MTDISCAREVVRSGWYITVLVGHEARSSIGLGRYSQVRRVVSLKAVRQSSVVLVQLDANLEFNEHVNQLCLPKSVWIPSAPCVLSGLFGYKWNEMIETNVTRCSTSDLCLTISPTISISTLDWAGALAVQILVVGTRCLVCITVVLLHPPLSLVSLETC